MAIVVAMPAAAGHLSLADVKNRLSEVVERPEREHGRVVITKHGRPAAVVLSIEDLEDLEDLEGLEETLDALTDQTLTRRIRTADREIDAGQAQHLTKEQALSLAHRR